MNNRNENNEIKKATDNNNKDKGRQKKGVLAVFAILAAALVILPLLNMIDFDALMPKPEEEEQEKEQQVTTTTLGDHHFAEPDYDEDIMKDPDYLKLDRSLHYTYMNETFGVMTVEEALEYGSVCAFFRRYFDSAIAGDSQSYNSHFTSECLKDQGKDALAPQKLYDIHVTCLSSRFLEDGDDSGEYKGYYLYEFDVRYSILDNNGTLRKDFLGDEGQVPLRFKVIEGEGEIKISHVSAYVYTNDPPEPEDEFENGILLIVLAVLTALLILVEVFTKKGVALALMIGCLLGVVLALLNVSAGAVLGASAAFGVLLAALFLAIGKKRKVKKREEQIEGSDEASDGE